MDTSSSAEIESDAEYDSHPTSPFRRYLNTQGKRKLSDSQGSTTTTSFNIPKVLDFSRSQKQDVKRIKDENHPVVVRNTWLAASKPTRADLCVHGKKLVDLEREIVGLVDNARASGVRMLVVSGPSGCGKSTCVKSIVGDVMRERVRRRREMSVSQIDDVIVNDEGFIVEFNISTGSSVLQFTEFLDQCKLLIGMNEKCVVIEELPNVFHSDTHREFQRAIQDWIGSDPSFELPPLVLVITEFDIDADVGSGGGGGGAFSIQNTVKVETVLGRSLMASEGVLWRRIRFNRVARTFLRKALKRVAKIEGVVVDRVVGEKIERLAGLGDLSNAINEFEFWYRFRGGRLDGVVEGKNGGIDIFHCIGKLIYGSKHENEEFEDFQKRYNIDLSYGKVDSMLVSADNISSEVSSSLNQFNLSCIENYAVINPRVDEKLCDVMDVFSVTDTILNRSRAFNVGYVTDNASFYSCYGLRGLFSGMGDNGSGGSRKVKFSRDSKMRKKLGDVLNEINEFDKRRWRRGNGGCIGLSKVDCVTIDGFYQSCIFDSFKFRKRYFEKTGSLLSSNVSRVGGSFNNTLIADEEFIEVGNEDKKSINMNDIEDEYFGVCMNEDDIVDDGDGGGEYESDPIESSSDESDDIFSDDSIILRELSNV